MAVWPGMEVLAGLLQVAIQRGVEVLAGMMQARQVAQLLAEQPLVAEQQEREQRVPGEQVQRTLEELEEQREVAVQVEWRLYQRELGKQAVQLRRLTAGSM